MASEDWAVDYSEGTVGRGNCRKEVSGWEVSGWEVSGWEVSGWEVSGWEAAAEENAVGDLDVRSVMDAPVMREVVGSNWCGRGTMGVHEVVVEVETAEESDYSLGCCCYRDTGLS